MGVGKPVISTPYWHAAELLADDHGRLVPFGDTAGFAAAITSLFDHPSLREILRSRAYARGRTRSEEHTSELQSLMRISYAVFCLKKKKKTKEESRQKK